MQARLDRSNIVTSTTEVTWSEIEQYLPKGTNMKCGRGGVYQIGRVNEQPRCSAYDSQKNNVRWHKLPPP